jgi:hypothetical protein
MGLGATAANRTALMRKGLALFVALLAGLACMAGSSRAADWMQVSCENPNGTAASSDGWVPDIVGDPEPGSEANTTCSPGAPMTASLSTSAAATPGVKEALEYVPPAGSTLAGGELDVQLAGTSYGPATDPNAHSLGVGALYEPALVDDAADAFLVCAQDTVTCKSTGFVYSGVAAIPNREGGDLFANAECVSTGGGECNTDPFENTWALAQVYWAHLLLSTGAVPQASGFTGSALQARASGVAHLVFTATDTGSGPGIYWVSAALDGRPVYSGTPNTNGGLCAPVGSDPTAGAPMYDSSQPCPATEVVDVPVPTTGLPDGKHELSVSVEDAAGTNSPVFDQTITTYNPQTTPAPRNRASVKARFVISWSWLDSHTVLNAIKVSKLPRGARIAVRCLGRGCPKIKLHAASGGRIKRLLGDLAGKRLQVGDKLLITVTAPRRRAERIELQMLENAEPRARLLKP